MKRTRWACLTVVLLGAAVAKGENQPPEMRPPGSEHKWLQKFVGTWESEVEITIAPDQPKLKGKGEETIRSLGGYWIIAEGKSETMGMKFQNVLTLGYDPDKGKYVGSWVDSAMDYMWIYEGTADLENDTLVVESTGPCHLSGGEMRKFRETTQFKSDDHRVFKGERQNEDGTWVTFLTGEFRRKK